MAEIWSTIVDMVSSGFMQFSIRDAIDILIVAYLIYRLLLLTRGTRAVQVLKGLAVLLLATSISKWINLQTITWLLDQAIRAGAIALVVIFQPELRRALEQIGRGKLFHRSGEDEDTAIQQFMKELTTAMKNMAARKVGALIILEHQTGLADIVSTGTRIDGMVSAALLENIFEPNTPLHDGATILRGSTVVAAGCFLPLSDNNTISRQLGTRPPGRRWRLRGLGLPRLCGVGGEWGHLYGVRRQAQPLFRRGADHGDSAGYLCQRRILQTALVL